MTTLTAVSVVIVLYGLLSGQGYGRALALSGSTPVGASIVVGVVAVPTFYFTALACIGLMAFGLTRGAIRPAELWMVPAGKYLISLFAVALLVTLLAPVFFNGQVVSGSRQPYQLVAGQLTSSNIAQLAYLLLGICCFYVIAMEKPARGTLIGIAAGLATILSFAAWLNQISTFPFPVGLFDNSPIFIFQDTLPGGAPRVRGIFSEPAGLATSSAITLAYSAHRFRCARVRERLFLILISAFAATLGIVSTSTTFPIALAALLALRASVFALRSFTTALRVTGPRLIATTLSIGVAIIATPFVLAKLQSLVDEKVGSFSYRDRSASDSVAFDLFYHTFGIGTGLGNNRASSFVASLLSTIGLLGTALLLAAIVCLFRRTRNLPDAQPVMWSLIALLVCKIISGPDLSDTSGILWISLGLLASMARSHGSSTLARPRLDALKSRAEVAFVKSSSTGRLVRATPPTPNEAFREPR